MRKKIQLSFKTYEKEYEKFKLLCRHKNTYPKSVFTNFIKLVVNSSIPLNDKEITFIASNYAELNTYYNDLGGHIYYIPTSLQIQTCINAITDAKPNQENGIHRCYMSRVLISYFHLRHLKIPAKKTLYEAIQNNIYISVNIKDYLK